MGSQVTAPFGPHEITLAPQAIGRVQHVVLPALDGLQEIQSGQFSEAGYKFVVALIPDVGRKMPLYEFLGYASRDAHEAEQYDEGNDPSPTLDEVLHALEMAAEISGVDTIRKWMGPELMRATGRALMANVASTISTNSASQSGMSPSESSTMKAPTSKESQAGQSLESVPSSGPLKIAGLAN